MLTVHFVDCKSMTVSDLKQNQDDFDEILKQIVDFNSIADNYGSTYNVKVRNQN